MNDRELVAESARADLCRLLAACYYQPGPEFAEERVFDAMAAAAGLIDATLAQDITRLGAAFSSENPQDLLVDYTRLFIGPIEAPARPYGSIWLENDAVVMGETTSAIEALYEAGGFELSDDFRDLPDHLSVELEFLYTLLFRQIQAGRIGDQPSLDAARLLARRLVEQHLGRWIVPFTQAMGRHAQTAYYRLLAGVTATFVAAEVARSGRDGPARDRARPAGT